MIGAGGGGVIGAGVGWVGKEEEPGRLVRELRKGKKVKIIVGRMIEKEKLQTEST